MEKLNSAVAILLVATLLIGIVAIAPRVFAVGATIYVSPASVSYTTATATIGTLFNVSIYCTDGGNQLGGADIKLLYNDNYINVTQWFNPSSDASYFYSPVVASPLPAPPDAGYVHIGPGSASVEIALSNPQLPPKAPWGHTGLICIFTFEVMSVPTKNTSPFTCALDISNAFLLDTSGNTLAGVTTTNGLYTITWAAPAAPWLGLTPATTTFGPDPPSAIGKTFVESLYLRAYNTAWGMSWVSFNFQWNSTVIDVLGLAVADYSNVTIAPGWTVAGESYTPGTLDDLYLNLTGTPALSGDALLATLTFTVLMQQNSPPAPSGTSDVSPLQFANGNWDQAAFGYLLGTSESGTVTVYALRTITPPWFYVAPQTTVLGPAPVIGTEFTIGVGLTGNATVSPENPTGGMDAGLKVIGAQFDLYFNDSLIVPVSITEGPFFNEDGYAPYGTFFFGTYNPGSPGPDAFVQVGTLILPNPHTGLFDQTSFVNGTGIITYITFEVITQMSEPYNLTSGLIVEPLFGEYLLDVTGNWVPVNDANNVNGLVIVEPFSTPGTTLDLYGGAVNDGYGPLVALPAPGIGDLSGNKLYIQFPAPYGGQGPSTPMDIVFPQSQIYLNAYLTYNYWPVQSKDVGFEIEGPYNQIVNGSGTFYVPYPTYQVWAKFTSTTDSNGVATLTYRMPWPCDNPDGITGVWKITATCTVADQVVNDTMMYYYQRVLYITSVTTDSFDYVHDQYVKVTVNYQTMSMQTYPVLFATVITDNLNVPIGMATYATTVGGTTFCTWLPGTFTVSILIPKWAFTGDALVHVTVYDKDPTIGGEAYTPEYCPDPVINIDPYNLPLSIPIPLVDNLDGSYIESLINNGYGTTGWPTPQDLCIDAPAYGVINTPDYLNVTAAAAGGYPYLLPGNIPEYTYTWYVNGTQEQTNTLVTTSTYSFTAGQAPFTVVGGTYHIVVVVTDFAGNTATADLYVYIHMSPFPPGP